MLPEQPKEHVLPFRTSPPTKYELVRQQYDEYLKSIDDGEHDHFNEDED